MSRVQGTPCLSKTWQGAPSCQAPGEGHTDREHRSLSLWLDLLPRLLKGHWACPLTTWGGQALLSGTLDGKRGNYWVQLNVQFCPRG